MCPLFPHPAGRPYLPDFHHSGDTHHNSTATLSRKGQICTDESTKPIFFFGLFTEQGVYWRHPCQVVLIKRWNRVCLSSNTFIQNMQGTTHCRTALVYIFGVAGVNRHIVSILFPFFQPCSSLIMKSQGGKKKRRRRMSTKPKPKCSHGDLFVCTSQKNAKRSTVRHDRLVLNACLRSLSSAFQVSDPTATQASAHTTTGWEWVCVCRCVSSCSLCFYLDVNV